MPHALATVGVSPILNPSLLLPLANSEQGTLEFLPLTKPLCGFVFVMELPSFLSLEEMPKVCGRRARIWEEDLRGDRESFRMGVPLTLHEVPDLSSIPAGRGVIAEGCPQTGSRHMW